jgi:hypothetical protein
LGIIWSRVWKYIRILIPADAARSAEKAGEEIGKAVAKAISETKPGG